MLKSLKSTFVQLLEALNHCSPLGVDKQTIDLLALFILYANYQRLQNKTFEAKSVDLSIKQIIVEEVNILIKNNVELAPYLEHFHDFLENSNDDLNKFIEYDFNNIEQVNVKDAWHICVSAIQPKKSRNTNILATPNEVLNMLTTLAGPQHSNSLLDLNARQGELSNSLGSAFYLNNGKLKSYCFKPFDYIINTLRAQLVQYEENKVNIDTPYQLTDIPTDYFDLVITNPPFGNMPKNALYPIKDTLPTYFLRQAMVASKANAKVLFIMPESFTHSSNKHELALRKELIKEQRIKAVIHLPETTFAPYTTVFTAIVFIDKSQKHSNIKLIKINKKLSEFADSELEKIVNFTNKDHELNSLPNITVDLEQVIFKNYDLRAETYLPASKPQQQRKLSDIRKEIDLVENELWDVREDIDYMIDLMESET